MWTLVRGSTIASFQGVGMLKMLHCDEFNLNWDDVSAGSGTADGDRQPGRCGHRGSPEHGMATSSFTTNLRCNTNRAIVSSPFELISATAPAADDAPSLN